MKKLGLLVRLEAKAGKEKDVEDFITGALPLANEEAGTVTWYAFRIDASTFGIFDTFSDEEGREAHLGGKIAKALIFFYVVELHNLDNLLLDIPPHTLTHLMFLQNP